MVIETRYRDITSEEMLKCVKPEFHKKASGKWEMEYRGKPVQIETPPATRDVHWACAGPVYKVAGCEFAVCPHIAEIGD